MSNRSARLRHPGTVGGSSGPRISRPRRVARCAADRPSARPLRVSGASAAFVHDSLSIVNVPRRCCRPGCPHYAVATLTFVYLDSTAVVGPLATAREPHSWDLCVAHAGRITAPRGWELVRHAGPLPTNPDEDDLVALADAVRESRDGVAMGSTRSAALRDYADPVNGAPVGADGALSAPPPAHQSSVGRRRGHLRVLPDPSQ